MKHLKLRKKLSCFFLASFSFLTICNLQAEKITYNWGCFSGATEEIVVEKGKPISLTNNGVSKPNYVLMGWSTMKFPLVVSSVAQETKATTLGKYYRLGSSFTPTEDVTLYAVWAIDKNNDGYPDYGGDLVRPDNREFMEYLLAKMEADLAAQNAKNDQGLKLRSLPTWNYDYDLKAVLDTVYYVGCTYNDIAGEVGDFRIHLSPEYLFNGKIAYATRALTLVVECDGVLEENSMIRANSGRVMDTIKIAAGERVDSVFNRTPFVFNAIQKDGQGILRIYFTDSLRKDSFAIVDDLNLANNAFTGTTGYDTWKKPFLDPETGKYTDVYTIKFNIYNKPVFESNIISQTLNDGYLKYKHVSGTPIKYMMRCIDDYLWQPAVDPLTKMEKYLITDSVSLCFRELDSKAGYQKYQSSFYLSDKFPADDNPLTNKYFQEVVNFKNECQVLLLEKEVIYYRNNEYGTPPPSKTGYLAINEYYTWFSVGGASLPASAPGYDDPVGQANYIADVTLALSLADGAGELSTTPRYGSTLASAIDSMLAADWYRVYAQRKADAITIPESCRSAFCFNFETYIPPVLQRAVQILTIPGVTSVPQAAVQHYVVSRTDFNFTLTFSEGQPLKVIAKGLNTQTEQELPGTDIGNGTYSYVIPMVQDAYTIQVTSEFATSNEIAVEGRNVWSADKTLYIYSEKAVVANIYTISGTLVKQLNLSAGVTTESLDSGIYIVDIDGGRYKIVIR